MIILVGYGSNKNKSRVYEKVDWTVCHSDQKFLPQRLILAIKQFSEPVL